MESYIQSILQLPPEMIIALKRLPNELLLTIKFNQLKGLNFIGMAQKIVSHLDELIESNVLNLKEENEVFAYCFMLFLAEENKKLYDFISNPSTFMEVVFKHYAMEQLSIFFNFEPERIKTNNKYERELLKLIFGYINRSGDIEWAISVINNVISENPKFVVENFVIIAILLKTVVLGLGFYPEAITSNIELFLDYSEKHNLNYFKMLFLHSLGLLRQRLTREDAMDYYRKSLEISEKLGSEHGNRTKNNIAFFYSKSEPKKALKLFKELYEKGNYQSSSNLLNIISCYFNLGEYNKSLQYAREYEERFQDQIEIDFYVLFHHCLLRAGKIKEARNKVAIIEQHVEQFQNQHSKNLLNIIFGRQNYFESNFSLALQYYDKSIKMLMDVKYNDYLVSILIEKIEILLDFYQIKPTEENLANLLNTISNYIQLTKELRLPFFTIEGLAMRAKFYKEINMIKNADRDLKEAIILAKENNFTNVLNELNQELVSLNEKQKDKLMFSSFKKILQRLFGYKIDNINIQKEKYETHGLMIITEDGIPIYDNYYTEKLTHDSALISGLITAIISFLNEISHSQGVLESIKHEELTILFSKINKFIMVGIFSKETFDVRYAFNNLTKEFGVTILSKHKDEEYVQISEEEKKQMDDLIQENLILSNA